MKNVKNLVILFGILVTLIPILCSVILLEQPNPELYVLEPISYLLCYIGGVFFGQFVLQLAVAIFKCNCIMTRANINPKVLKDEEEKNGFPYKLLMKPFLSIIQSVGFLCIAHCLSTYI